MIKKLLMKMLGIESIGERLARLEANHRKLMETIVRIQNSVDRLSQLCAAAEDGQHKVSIADHMAQANMRLDYYRKVYAEAEVVLQIARDTHAVSKANKGIYA